MSVTRLNRVIKILFLVILIASYMPAQQRKPSGKELTTVSSEEGTKADLVAAAQPKEIAVKANAPQLTTTINLLLGQPNNVQLGGVVNGQFSYPFHFSVTPEPANGISISSKGLISGSPSQVGDQSFAVRFLDSNEKEIANYTVTLHVGDSAPIVMMGTVPPEPQKTAKDTSSSTTADLKIATDPIYKGGNTISGSIIAGSTHTGATASAKKAQQPSDSTNGNANNGALSDPSSGSTSNSSRQILSITRTSKDEKKETETAEIATDANNGFSYQFSTPFGKGDVVSISGDGLRPATTKAQSPPVLSGEDVRVIVGYQQAGANSSNFTQDWFLDFYASRPVLSLKHDQEKPWRWWGNVRVASFPQSGNQSVAEVATGIATQIGSLKLNQLAQGAEFLTGVEKTIKRSPPLRGFAENTLQRFELGLIAGFGATGFFDTPSNDVQVFQTPSPNSSQYPLFQKQFPGVNTANVGFVSPSLARFPKQYLAGVRLMTRYVDPSGAPLVGPPAMLSFTVGQNEVVTANHLSGVVSRIEGFYPLPFGKRSNKVTGAFSSLYLFGTAQMKLGATKAVTPLLLQPATGVQSYDPTVTIVTTPNSHDVYRIGFGVDLVGVVQQLTGGSAKGTTTSAAPQKSTDTSKEKPNPNSSPNE